MIIFLTILLLICNSRLTLAQEGRLTGSELEIKLLSIKNPFESQLPKKEPEPVPAVMIKEPLPPVVKNFDPEPRIKPIQETETRRPIIQEKVREIVPMPEIPVPTVTITGIIWNSDRPQAIINGKIVNIGDTILDLKITDIQKTGIEALFHGKSVTIKTQRSPL